MSKRRSPLLACFSLFWIAACLAAVLAAVLLYEIPLQAEQSFGPPAEGLSTSDRYYLQARLLLQSGALTNPSNPGAPEQTFQVGLGESTAAIIERLFQEGLIGSPDAFRIYLQYSGLDTSIQAGEYRLSPAMTPVQIARAMQDATPSHVTFNVLAGWRLEEVAAALPTSGLSFTPEMFLEAAAVFPEGYSFTQAAPPNATLEGFLYPGSYELDRRITTDEFIKVMLDRFEANLTPTLREGYERQSLDLFQAVTLASIVEREAVMAEEMPLIASVFYNRLANGMKLDSDPTVQYALGYNESWGGWWKNPLLAADLQFDSAYNTYANTGLPPGPIDNPGSEALQSVATPAQTPYFYFRSMCNGSGKHVFAETFEEHLNNACP